MFARAIFAIVDFAARRGLSEAPRESSAAPPSAKLQARRTGVRGETYAYWYLRRRGYILVARNFTFPGMKGELDMVGYDGNVLAFVEVKTRSATAPGAPTPEDAVNPEKRRHLSRMATQFLRTRRIESVACRFDVLAIEMKANARPVVRLHKGAFRPETH